MMAGVQKRKIRWAISLFLVMLYFSGLPAQAQYGGGSGTTASAETNTYVFLPGQSTVVQTGGIAGVHWTYSVEGLFQLTVDPNAGTASFAHVNANATDDSPLRRTLDPNEVFNMTSLLGAVLDDTTISFTGKAADGSDVLITLTIEDDLAYLVGETIPPPNTADFFLFSLDAVAQRKYGGGSGTSEDPYLIFTAEQMNEIGLHEEDWDNHFKLMADIDLSGYTGTSFNIIGKYAGFQDPNTIPFTGVFDGNGQTISNFTYDSNDTNCKGLFGHIDGENAEVRNLGLLNANVDAGTRWKVGSLVGYIKDGTISDCYVEGSSLSGGGDIGGLVGNNYGGNVANCQSIGSVTIGGPVGPVGGLVGSNGNSGMSSYGKVSNSYSTSTVNGHDKVGGLVGWNRRSGRVSNCYSMSTVSGGDNVGGLVGWNEFSGEIVNCYADGDVTGIKNVGGLVGRNFCRKNLLAWIRNCYSVGQVTGGAYVGGLVGLNWGGVEFSFWDVETSGQINMCGSEGAWGSGCDDGNGKTTAEMQAMSTFTYAGWDFVDESVNGTGDIWRICEGTNYPRFVWQIPAGDFVCPDGITIDDFVFFIEHWRDDNCDVSNDYCQGTDLDFSGTVDEADLEILIENWLAGGDD